MKRVLYLLIILLAPLHAYAQMLFSENMTMSIDSTKTLQGMITPSMTFQTEKEDVFTFRNSSNINLLDRAFEVYPYIESQWAASRGMAFKFSGGLQSRYRLVNTSSTLVFATAGLFYEHEKWEHPDATLAGAKYAYSNHLKSHLSLSLRNKIGEHWELTTTAIHQGAPESYFKKARFGGAVDLKYHITPSVGIRGTYRLIYDTDPIVDIRKDYNVVDAGLDISF